MVRSVGLPEYSKVLLRLKGAPQAQRCSRGSKVLLRLQGAPGAPKCFYGSEVLTGLLALPRLRGAPEGLRCSWGSEVLLGFQVLQVVPKYLFQEVPRYSKGSMRLLQAQRGSLQEPIRGFKGLNAPSGFKELLRTPSARKCSNLLQGALSAF